MTRLLQSYCQGNWQGAGSGRVLTHAASGEAVAELPQNELDFAGVLDYARRKGGEQLRRLTFHERGLMLKSLAQYLMERKETYYALSGATGATRTDSWIDIEGGIGTLFTFSGKGRREMPNSTVYIDGAPEPLSRNGTFIGQHICLSMQGAAIHINAFNFPCWGMLEKIAPALLAGLPNIVKPASQTSFLTELMVRDIIDSGILPEGALQLICGQTGDLLDHVTCEDVITFTGSQATGVMLRQTPAVIANSVRFNMEADSLNCAILAPDAAPGEPEFDLFVREVVREMTVKTGQKCTAIRRAIVPEKYLEDVSRAISEKLAAIQTGHPDDETTRMGPLVSAAQRVEVSDCVNRIAGDAQILCGDPANGDGAFISPVLLVANDPLGHCTAHDVEAFGPVCTLMPYDTLEDAVEIARRGRGSLVGSVFTHDQNNARELILGAGSLHGRLPVIDRDCAKESTGHGSPLPGLVHGGPGRAGGGEEMGGVRGVFHYMQRSALQGSPDMLTAVTGRWLPGANRTESESHPFRKHFHELELGDTVFTLSRKVELEDIEHFAEFTGDKFYAHMDDEAAKANPFFDGRVAHGYFIVSAAAGLFVDPDPGPVLANYGLENLRFMQPVYPGDVLNVALTCKQKTARVGEEYGEVRWDTTVTNQDGAVVAQYDVLTLVAYN